MLDRSQKEFDVRGGRGPGEIGELHATFLIPDAGAFGRDKTVSVDEASAAEVSYVLDGQLGFTTFPMRMMIGKRCGFVMQFSLGQSLVVPG